jgi:hypothetical protein
LCARTGDALGPFSAKTFPAVINLEQNTIADVITAVAFDGAVGSITVRIIGSYFSV